MASNHGVFKYEGNNFSLIQIQKVKLGISVKLITSISSVIMKELIFMKTMSFKLNNINGGWNLIKSTINEWYLQTSYSGILIYPNVQNLSKNCCKRYFKTD
jgi:hypothetical protein